MIFFRKVRVYFTFYLFNDLCGVQREVLINLYVSGSGKVLKRNAWPSQYMPDVEESFAHDSVPLLTVPSVFAYETTEQPICCIEFSGHCSLLCDKHSNFSVLMCVSPKLNMKKEPNNVSVLLAKANRSLNIIKEIFSSLSGHVTNFHTVDLVGDMTFNFCHSSSSYIPILTLFQNDLHLKLFIGVSHCLLESLTKLILEFCDQDIDQSILPLRERVALTLCKLKLNLSFSCLSSIFGLERHYCCVYFVKTLPLLSKVLKCAVCWLSKEEVMQSMPEFLEKFSDTRVILDCFDITVNSVLTLLPDF